MLFKRKTHTLINETFIFQETFQLSLWAINKDIHKQRSLLSDIYRDEPSTRFKPGVNNHKQRKRFLNTVHLNRDPDQKRNNHTLPALLKQYWTAFKMHIKDPCLLLFCKLKRGKMQKFLGRDLLLAWSHRTPGRLNNILIIISMECFTNKMT